MFLCLLPPPIHSLAEKPLTTIQTKKHENKKLFLLLFGVAFLSVAIGIVVACSNDDAEKASKSVSSKSCEALVMCPNAVTDFWDACDNAYRNDSSALRIACMNNDYASFFELTGISDEMIATMLEQTESFKQDYLAVHPECQSSSNGECHCSTGNLTTMFYYAKEIYRVYEELGITEPTLIKSNPSGSPELIACLNDCDFHYNFIHHYPDSLALCQEICYILEKFREVTPDNPGLEPPLIP